MSRTALIALALAACTTSGTLGDPDGPTAGDDDDDGYSDEQDCDDTDPDVHPGAEEIPYDGVDNDCDPSTPDDDLDGDGFDLEQDCNDADAAVNPGAEEVAGNGVDDDCDPLTCAAAGFADTPQRFEVPDEYGAEALDLMSSTVNCATQTPAFGTLDLDADGVLDLVVTEDPCDDDRGLGVDTWLVYPGDTDGFGAAEEWPIPDLWGSEALDVFASPNDCGTDTPAFALLDLTGDGAPDLVVTEEPCDADEDTVGVSEWWVFENTHTGFASTATSWAIPAEWGSEALDQTASANDCGADTPAYTTLDLTGDGRPDLVITEAPCDADEDTVGVSEWRVYENTGSGFASVPTSWAIPTLWGPEGLDTTASANDCDLDTPAFVTLDLTADDRPDLVVTEAPCDAETDTVGVSEWLLFINHGSGFAATGESWSIPALWGSEALDVTSSPNECGADIPAFTTLDLTRDGRPDLVVTEQPCDDPADTVGVSEWLVYANTGAGFAEAALSWGLPPGWGTEALDVTASFADCGTDTPAFATAGLVGDALLDLVVTEDPCGTTTLGEDHWDVYPGTCDL